MSIVLALTICLTSSIQVELPANSILSSEAPSTQGHFGDAIAGDNDLLAVGHSVLATDLGKVSLFRHSHGVGFTLDGSLESPHANPVGGDFGRVVAVDGDRVLVAAPREPSVVSGHFGIVYLFERQPSGSWSLSSTFDELISASHERIGDSLVIEGDDIFIGSRGGWSHGGLVTGRVYHYHFDGSAWVAQPRISPPQSTADTTTNFGVSIAFLGNLLVVGADESSTNGILRSGTVYAYDRASPTTGFTHSATLTSSSPYLNGDFGGTLALREDGVLAIGAEDERPFARVHVLRRMPAGQWVEEAALKGPDGSQFAFGSAVHFDSLGVLSVADPRYAKDDELGREGAVFGYCDAGGAWSLVTQFRRPEVLSGNFTTDLTSGDGWSAASSADESFGGFTFAGRVATYRAHNSSDCIRGYIGDIVCSGSNAQCALGTAATLSGCRNSTGVGGVLRVSGRPNLVSGAARATAYQLPPHSVAVGVVGEHPQGGSLQIGQIGNGALCIPLVRSRLSLRITNAGGLAEWNDLFAGGSATWISGLSAPLQIWYRDLGHSNPSLRANTTNAVLVTPTDP